MIAFGAFAASAFVSGFSSANVVPPIQSNSPTKPIIIPTDRAPRPFRIIVLLQFA